MFSRIVAGTDGSDTANAAVAEAIELAKRSGAELHLVNAYKRPSSAEAAPFAASAAPGTTDAAFRQVGEEMLAEVARSIEGLDVHTHVRSGGAADALVDVADAVGADVIVVGSKGMTGARRIIGSVPNSVAHRSPCHVLIVKTT